MAVLISCQNLRKTFGSRPLFDGLTLGINDGERLGLLGVNGSGKSTLLRLLAGLEQPDGGTVSARRGLRLGYLAQEESFPAGQMVEEILAHALEGTPLDERERSLRVAEMLQTAGFTRPDPSNLQSPGANLPVETLSGGWRKRLAIARELIRAPDLLLLDEPTNHLDLGGILWLERQLMNAPFAYVLVSHDRRLLENATNRVVELSPAYAEGFLSVNGRYGDFLERREAYLQAQAHQQTVLQARVRRELEWLRASAPARSTKAGGRIRQAGELMQELAEVRARNTQERERGPGIEFDASGRKSRELLVAKGLRKELGGRTLFNDLDLMLSPRRRLGLLGPNGCGKTTLLRLLTGALAPDAGTLRRAEGLRTVTFDQDRRRVDPALPLQRALGPSGDTVIYRDRPYHIQAWAKRFLFRPEQLGMPVGQLSGGEQARVLIARMMLEPADLLILDEPTNDLDIPTLEILEESLADFPGAVVLVTHDRAMLDGVCTGFLALDGCGDWRPFADYAQWERWRSSGVGGTHKVGRWRSTDREGLESDSATPPSTRFAGTPHSATKGLSYDEHKELGRLEGRIETAERAVRKIREEMEDPAVAADHLRLQERWAALQEAEQRVSELYVRWEELETKRAG